MKKTPKEAAKVKKADPSSERETGNQEQTRPF